MLTLAKTCGATMIGFDHVAPPSVERITATDSVSRWLCPRPPLVWIRSNPSISTPLAGPAVGTTIWLPIVWFFSPGSKMGRPVLQVTPPSVVLENMAGPRNAGEWSYAPGFAFSLGETSLSHAAYAVRGLSGSAVTVSLSFNTVNEASYRAVTGVCHVMPPSVERLIMIALAPPNAGPFALKESLIEYTIFPSDEKLTHGSVALFRSPGEPGAAPSQRVNAGWLDASCQVRPPLVETTFVSPFEPPSFHRSCCTLATRCSGFVGFTVTYGSTSESG